MNTGQMNDGRMEDLLRETLRSHADDAPFAPDRTAVVNRARSIRRHRRQGLAALTAAAVVAIVVPVSLALGQDDDAGTGPANQDHTPKPSPTKTVMPRYDSLAAIPRGKDTALPYVGPDALIHDNGTTTPVPGGAKDVTDFGEYQGNWVVQRDLKTDVYVGATVVRSGAGNGIRYSSDRTEIAYQIGSTLYTSSRNTMGGIGAHGMPAPKDSALLGYLPGGPAMTSGQDSVTIVGSPNRTIPLPLMPTVVSQSTGLVGGIVGTVAQGDYEGAVADVATGTILWHNKWGVLAFSDDGKYVVAKIAAENGNPSILAILDARTARVIARTPNLGPGVQLVGNVAWDGHRVIMDAAGNKARSSALLALDLSGSLTRVTDVAPGPVGKEMFVLGAQP